MAETQAAKKKNDWRKSDWLLKLLAVACAVVLWFYADAESNPLVTKHFDVPVQYVNQADDLAVEGGAQTVRVTIRGKEADTYSLRSDDFTATVDLSGAEAGDRDYTVRVQAPSLIERYSVTPDKVRLQIDQVQSKEVPVRVRTSGQIAAGYELEGTEVLPGTVTVTGLGKALEAVTDVETAPIDLSQITEETTLEVALHTDDGVQLQGAARVAVHFLIREKQDHGSYQAEIQLYHIPDGLEVALEQTSATVVLSGSNALLDSQRELSRIAIYVDCSDVQEGVCDLPVQVDYSGALTVGQLTPSTVRATVTAAAHTAVDDNMTQDDGSNQIDEGETT